MLNENEAIDQGYVAGIAAGAIGLPMADFAEKLSRTVDNLRKEISETRAVSFDQALKKSKFADLNEFGPVPPQGSTMGSVGAAMRKQESDVLTPPDAAFKWRDLTEVVERHFDTVKEAFLKDILALVFEELRKKGLSI